MTERRFEQMCLLLGLAVLLSGCAWGPFGDGLAPLVGLMPLALKGMNIGIGDLVNRGAGYGTRLAAYLDEIAAAGYAKKVRMVMDPGFGPQFLEHGLPVVRGKGFKVLAIFNQHGPNDGNQASTLEGMLAWVGEAIPRIRDVLMAIEIVNEPWLAIKPAGPGPVPPADFVPWHNGIYDLCKQLAPEVDIWIGSVGGNAEAHDWWQQVAALGPRYDAVSLHLYGRGDSIPPGVVPPYYITETDRRDIAAAELFLFTWNESGRYALRPGGGLLP